MTSELQTGRDMEGCRCNLIVGPPWHWHGVTEENPKK
jgi:hypothetical protein